MKENKTVKDLAKLLAESIIQDEFAGIVVGVSRDSVAAGIELLFETGNISLTELVEASLLPIIKRRVK